MTNAQRPSLISTLAWGLVVLLLMVVFFGLLVGPALRHKGVTTTHGYAPNQPPRDLTEFPAQKGKTAPGLNLKQALVGDPAQLAWAKEEYGKICIACHGATGKGDGPAGLALQARDFTKSAAWKNGPKITQIYQTLSRGLPPKMPAYDTYTPAQRMALAHVVQSFMAFPVPAASAAEIAAMDQEHSLSAGIREAGRVPVRVAAARLAEVAVARRLNRDALPADLRALVQDAGKAGQSLAAQADLALPQLARALSAGAPANGFSGGVAALGGADWQRLIQACRAALEPVQP
ncbi:MAG: c-type cytochrome [Candidatus Delongbacteria bacterium]